MKKTVTLIPFIIAFGFSGSIQAGSESLDLGDTAYIYLGQGMGDAVHAQVSIEDVRDKKARIRVKAHCWSSSNLYGCRHVELRGTKYNIDDYYWVNKSDLKGSW